MGALWFGVVAVMIAVYVVLDGYDLGVGMAQLFLCKSESDRLRALASSEDHIITGHDPITSLIYPQVSGIDAAVFRVDAPPTRTIRDAIAAWKSRKT